MRLTRVLRTTVAVVAVAAPAFLVVTAFPAATASARSSICVALVVDARTLGGPTASDCATVPSGSSGYDVLRAAGHTVGFRQDGIICTIDDRPADGCAATDAEHYWAYFHRAPHSSHWTYSDEGATTYEPDADSTEGWVWRDGSDATPQNVPYDDICKNKTSQTPAASPRPTTTRTRSTAGAAATPAATTTAATSTRAGAPHRADAQPRHHRTHTLAASAATLGPSNTPTSTPRPVRVDAHPPDSPSGRPPYPVLAGVAVIAMIGGIAGWRMRRRGDGG